MINTYAKAYTEVLEILKYFSEEEYSKIPQEKIEFYKNNMDKNYNYNINPNIDLSKQYISKEANAILITLFRDYFATESQKKTLNNLLNQNQNKLENIRREKYNSNNIFSKNYRNIDIEDKENKQELALIEINDMKWYKKIWKFIKGLLRKWSIEKVNSIWKK